jgi:simple sugar transport system ATP-binding protein
VQALLRVVADLGAASVATLFVSHRLTEVLEVADRVTILRDGTKIGTYDASEVDSDRLVRLMTGLSLGTARPRRPRAAFAPARFEVAGLSHAREFHDVSFSVSAGEVVGLTGLLGAGRTELALALFGMTRPDAGCIRLDGTTLRPGSNRDALRHGIAYVPEDRLTLGLVLDHSIASNITVTVLPRLTSRFGLIDRRAYAREVRHWVEALRIKTRDPENPVKTLSGGNQQRVVLAKWIARQPRLLILDSPTVGIDIAAKQEIYEIVDRLAAEGMGVIFISDEISEVLEHTDRILVMREGRIIAEHAATETSEEQLTGYFDA